MTIDYQERLCKIVRGDNESLWANEWIKQGSLLNALGTDIIDRERLNSVNAVVEPDEIDLFSYE